MAKKGGGAHRGEWGDQKGDNRRRKLGKKVGIRSRVGKQSWKGKLGDYLAYAERILTEKQGKGSFMSMRNRFMSNRDRFNRTVPAAA